jgi:hypothetical protein
VTKPIHAGAIPNVLCHKISKKANPGLADLGYRLLGGVELSRSGRHG